MSLRERDFRLVKAADRRQDEAREKIKSSEEKSSLQTGGDGITLGRDELRRRYLKLRRAFIAFEQLMIEQGLDLKSE